MARTVCAGGREFRLKDKITLAEYRAWSGSNWMALDDGIAGLNGLLAEPVTDADFPDMDAYIDLHRAVTDFFVGQRWDRKEP